MYIPRTIFLWRVAEQSDCADAAQCDKQQRTARQATHGASEAESQASGRRSTDCRAKMVWDWPRVQVHATYGAKSTGMGRFELIFK